MSDTATVRIALDASTQMGLGLLVFAAGFIVVSAMALLVRSRTDG
jgi:hypothetical protein